MSIIRTGLILGATVMFLPVEERKQSQLANTASLTAQQTASFCERNPSTCATGSELWTLFLRKAEFGVELGAKLVREQLLSGAAPLRSGAPAASAPVETSVQAHAPAAAVVQAQQPRLERRATSQPDQAPRWR